MEVHEIEKVLIEEFNLILSIDYADSASNFFVCGGDSLSMNELIAHLRSRLKLDVELEEFPFWSSVAEIAAWLDDLPGALHPGKRERRRAADASP